MNYAIKTPDGKSLYKVVLNAELPEGRTLADLDLWPVDTTIPEGYRQDFSQGPKTARGWQLVDDKVVPYLVELPPPDNTPPEPTFEDRLAALEAKEAELRTEQETLKADVDTLKSDKR